MRALVAPLAVVALAGGCGDLSQEDLLFRAAVPAKEAVAVLPPGSEGAIDDDDDADTTEEQGLELRCSDGDLRCEAQKIATSLNGSTFGLLDVVDAVAALPPSTRERGRRAWGPHYDVAKDTTFRFEMVRQDDGVTFVFCLHARRGRLRSSLARDLSCDVTEHDSGLVRVLSGSFSPSRLGEDVGGARFGAGTMRLEVAQLGRLGTERPFARVLDFAFDNRDGRTAIHIDVVGTPVVVGGAEQERDAAYDFERDAAGAGSFAFVFFRDFVNGDGFLPPAQLERARLLARWQADRSGRAVGHVDEGDAAPDAFTVHQCWDTALSTTYAQSVDGTRTGDEERCVFGADDVVPPPP